MINLSYAGWLSVLFGLTLLFTTLSLFLQRRAVNETYSTPARFFLVALRLAIGWHCFIEGMEKLHTPGWSSEPYLREATGPLAEHFRRLAGDRLIDKLTMSSEKELPPALDAEWNAYFNEFTRHYQLEPEKISEADKKFQQARDKTTEWLAKGKEEVVKIAPYPPDLHVTMTMKQRLAEHERLQQRLREAEAALPSSDADTQKRYKDAKADLNKWRASLKKSLDAQTAAMKEALSSTLSTGQKSAAEPVTEPVKLPMNQWTLLDWSDVGVTWGLLVLGGGLLLGLFSRLASFGLGILVLSFYLAMPPLPGWPEGPRLEGHYLIVNKTLIEVLALFALTFIPTGRWAGLDALLSALFGRRAAKPAA